MFDWTWLKCQTLVSVETRRVGFEAEDFIAIVLKQFEIVKSEICISSPPLSFLTFLTKYKITRWLVKLKPPIWSICLTYVSHEMLECRRLDGPAAILTKNPEGHPDHVLIINSPHLGRHHVAKLRKLNLSREVSVKLNKRIVYNQILPSQRQG